MLNEIFKDVETSYFAWEGVKDTFLKRVEVSVPDDNTDFSITLDRVVGKLEVILTDNIPENAHTMEYSLSGINVSLDFYTGDADEPHDFIKTEISLTSEIGTPNYKLEFFSFVGDEAATCDLTINIFDQEKTLIATKTLSNISVFRNKITRLSGEMFTANTGTENSFSLEVDPDWLQIIEQSF